MIPAQVYRRVAKVTRPDGRVGSAVIVPYEAGEFFVTSAHVLGNHGLDEVTIVREGQPMDIGAWSRPTVDKRADIAVSHAAAGIPEVAGLTLVPSADGVVFTQDVYFAGFPFLGKYSFQFPQMPELPFVKKAILSSAQRRDGEDVYYLDGHNNDGFSGGPVAFRRGATSDWQILGIVVACPYGDEASVKVGGEDTTRITVLGNSGIIEVTSIMTVRVLMDAILHGEAPSPA